MIQNNFNDNYIIKIIKKNIYECNALKIFFVSTALLGIVFFNSCSENPIDDGGGISLPPPIPIMVYHSPIWHPSGEFIGFNHIPIKSLHYVEGSKYPDRYELENDSSGFWLINADGTNMRRIFQYQLQTPAWSPDGQWIAFVMNAQIYKMPFDGNSFDTTRIIQLTNEGRNFFPAWSPDGQWIAFDTNNESPNGMNFIWKMKSNGSNKERIAYDPSSGEIRMPYWSKDGNRIVHQRYIGVGSPEIFIMDSAGNNLVRLTYDQKFDSYPKYSSDGKSIAFASRPLNDQVNLWLMDSTGGNLQQLTTEGTNDDSGLPFSWNPTENTIVFTQRRFDEWLPQNGTLWIIDLETGEKRQLTFNPEPTD